MVPVLELIRAFPYVRPEVLFPLGSVSRFRFSLLMPFLWAPSSADQPPQTMSKAVVSFSAALDRLRPAISKTTDYSLEGAVLEAQNLYIITSKRTIRFWNR